jgi:hypothetical protein
MLLFAAGVMVFVETVEVAHEAREPRRCVIELCAPSSYMPADMPENGRPAPLRPVSWSLTGTTTPMTNSSGIYSSTDWTKPTY